MTWKVPRSDGGSEITGYIIEMKDVHGVRWMRATRKAVKEPHMIVSNLVTGREYQFQVAAQNEAGQGPFSKPSEKVVARTPVGKYILLLQRLTVCMIFTMHFFTGRSIKTHR